MRKSITVLVISILLLAGLLVLDRKPSSVTPVPEVAEGSDVAFDATNQATDHAEALGEQDTSSLVSDSNADSSVKVDLPEKTKQQTLRQKRTPQFVSDASGQRHPVRTYTTLALPNDPSASQWWVPVTGTEALWDAGPGSYKTTLAIIDTGFALNHEEFSNRLYVNEGESGATSSENPSMLNCTDRSLTVDESCNLIDDNFDGIVDNESGATVYENSSLLNCTDQGLSLDKSCNLIDDDGNGLIDDTSGFDFVNFDRSAQAGETNPDGAGTTHGTAVMGVAAATGNNGLGIAGVDWFSELLPLQALDDDEYGNTITVGKSIRYAADQGADVISISLGTIAPDTYVREAVAYALARGSIVVAAAGNDGCECMLYPAGYEEVLAVGASNTSDGRASFSSYGSALDVIAPGTSMTSAYWSADNDTSAYTNGLAGTSFATPYVAGLLSVMKSHMETASSPQLIGALTEQTNKLTLTDNQNHSNMIGFGRVSAQDTMQRIATAKRPAFRYLFAQVSSGNKLANYEPASNTNVYQCETARLGTSSVFKLTKGSSVFYTMSYVERYKAVAQGFVSQIFASNLCIDLPVDEPQQQRVMSIAREFENREVDKY